MNLPSRDYLDALVEVEELLTGREVIGMFEGFCTAKNDDGKRFYLGWDEEGRAWLMGEREWILIWPENTETQSACLSPCS